MDIKPPVHEGVDWIRLAQDGDKWYALVIVIKKKTSCSVRLEFPD
jgi:hypothetical protein